VNKKKFPLAILLVAAIGVAVPFAAAQEQVNATGSSGVFLSIGQATFNDVAGGAGVAHIWTAKGSNAKGCVGNCVSIHDPRSGSITDLSGNIWVVWDNSTPHKVWAYTQVDTIVGNRAFFGGNQPLINSCALAPSTACPGQQLIPKSVIGNQVDEMNMPADVYNAINGVTFDSLFSELRPEDAAQMQTRVVSTLTSTLSGLGYGTGPKTLVGTTIQSAWDSATAVPVAFAIKGNDPFTKKPVLGGAGWTSQNLGAYPVVFVDNRTNTAGLGLQSGGVYQYLDVSDAKVKLPGVSYKLQKLLAGDCTSSLIGPNYSLTPFAVNLNLREPLSGTYTTTEYTEVRNKGNTTNGQEKGVGVPTGGTSANPLNQACPSGGGSRFRGIGTGEVVAGNGSGSGGVLNVADSIAYFFWSFSNGSKLTTNPGGNPNYGYFTLDGVDPLAGVMAAPPPNQEIPYCTAPCPVPEGTSFTHLRDGTYRSWTIVRVVNAGPSTSPALQTLITDAQNDVNLIEPDFVPWDINSHGDPGMRAYRSHFTADGILGVNDDGTGNNEHGGDVGGMIFARPEINDAAHLNKKQ